MATNNNLNLPTQEFSATGTSSSFDFGNGMIAGKPITAATKVPSPLMVKLASAVAKARATKPPVGGNGFLP